jgi:hypothetical protein
MLRRGIKVVVMCLKVARHLSDEGFKKRKVKQSYYRPGHEGGKVVSPTHRPPLPPQEIFLVLISVRG